MGKGAITKERHSHAQSVIFKTHIARKNYHMTQETLFQISIQKIESIYL